MVRLAECGHFHAAVSIRNGHGSRCHDRVYRFRPMFQSHAAAWAYATQEGRQLVAHYQLA